MSEKSLIGLSWSFQGNNFEQGNYSASFVLENLGGCALEDQGWTIYFSQQGLGVIDESVTGNVKIEHINGDFLRIVPLQGFRLEAGDSVEISYRKPGFMFLHSEAPLHPYMVRDNASVSSEEEIMHIEYRVLPLPSLEKFYPQAMNIVLPDAAWVYEQNGSSGLLSEEETGWILPTPAKQVYFEEFISLEKDLEVYFQEDLENEAGYLAGMLQQVRGSAPPVRQGTLGGPGKISLHLMDQKGRPES